MQMFENTNINISSDGRPHLGISLGTHQYAMSLSQKQVEQWSIELRTLSNIAEGQPHAVYAALMHGLSSKWSHLSRTIPHISYHPLANGPDNWILTSVAEAYGVWNLATNYHAV